MKELIILTRVRNNFRENRKTRYLSIVAVGLLFCWLPAVAYLVLTPKSFTSTFIMVIPGPGTTSTLNLENIGSASSSNASVFSSPDISPTENYKKILLSHKLIYLASESLGEDPEKFVAPKVDLVDQTKIMTVSVTGKNVDEANHRANVILATFMGMLDNLRTDEINILQKETDKIIKNYETKLAFDKVRLLGQQAKTGLMSKEQYGTIVTNLEKTREEKRNLEARISKGEAEKTELMKILGITTEKATYAMILRADPIFQGLLDTLSKEESEIAVLNGIRGANNPRLQDALAEQANVTRRLLDRGHELVPLSREEILKFRDVSLRDERARLFEKLIDLASENKSLEANLQTILGQLATEQKRVLDLTDAVSELENLTRAVQVSEAVFASTLAKIDTSKADFFSSYPMIQILDAPFSPDRASSPRKLYAFLGAGVATIFLMMLVFLMWAREKMFKKILRYL